MREAWTAAIGDTEAPAAAMGDHSLVLTPRRTGTDGFFFAMLRRDG
jgi:hypothetical protein